MIYLDNAATTFPKPECVYDEVNTIQRTIAVNVGRGSYSAASEAMSILDNAKKQLAELVNASNCDDVVFTPSATIAANEIILGLEWNKFKNVYVTPFEHNAIMRPLNRICNQFNIEIKIIPFLCSQQLYESELDRMFAENPPDYVFINHVSNVTGLILPIKEIAEKAKEYDSTVIIDGSQSLGLISVDLRCLPIDFMIFAGHKNLYSSWGIGGFIRNSKYPLKPFLSGGTGSDSMNLEMSDEFPEGFEFASPNIIAIASLNSSLRWLKEISVENIFVKKNELMKYLLSELKKSNVELYIPEERADHVGVVSFNVPGYNSDEIGMILSQDYDIAVRTGYHCAPFVHSLLDTKKTNGTVRVSLGYFNTKEDIDALISAIIEIMEE